MDLLLPTLTINASESQVLTSGQIPEVCPPGSAHMSQAANSAF